jgi:hypothetical protein
MYNVHVPYLYLPPSSLCVPGRCLAILVVRVGGGGEPKNGSEKSWDLLKNIPCTVLDSGY